MPTLSTKQSRRVLMQDEITPEAPILMDGCSYYL